MSQGSVRYRVWTYFSLAGRFVEIYLSSGFMQGNNIFAVDELNWSWKPAIIPQSSLIITPLTYDCYGLNGPWFFLKDGFGKYTYLFNHKLVINLFILCIVCSFVQGDHYSVLTLILKEYYEIVDEARPLSGFFPTHAHFFTEYAFLIMKLTSFQVSERSEL